MSIKRKIRGSWEAVHTKKRKCPICGEIFKPKVHTQKTCLKTECRYENEKERIKLRVQKHRQKYRKTQKQARYEAMQNAAIENGKAVLEQYHTGKGTGSLGGKPNKNFDTEQILVQKELKRLKIRT